MRRNKNRKENIRNQGSSLITVTKPMSIISEQFRTIRTNIQYAMIDKEFNTIMVTSAGENEGKSTISVNLASVMADENKKILIIDADLRKPTLHKTFNLNNNVGLTNVLVDHKLNFDDIIEYSKDSNLYVLPAGPLPPNPVELLSSNRMSNLVEKLQNIFDLVVIDTPPVLPVADSQVVAKLVDGIVFVIREGVADKYAVGKAIELLNVTGVNIIGSVYNDADISKSKGYYGYIKNYGD